MGASGLEVEGRRKDSGRVLLGKYLGRLRILRGEGDLVILIKKIILEHVNPRQRMF